MDELLRGLYANTTQAADRYDQLQALLTAPETLADTRLSLHWQAEAERLRPLATAHHQLMDLDKAIEDCREAMQQDAELRPLYWAEIETLSAQQREIAADLGNRLSLLYRGAPMVQINLLGSGQLLQDTLTAYRAWAKAGGVELSVTATKDGYSLQSGTGGWGLFQHEVGLHRAIGAADIMVTVVQHTPVGACPELDYAQLRIDIFCASGKGGQNINKVETAVRVTHLPTGLVVTCQDERSQLANKKRALERMRELLYQQQLSAAQRTKATATRCQLADRTHAVRVVDYTAKSVLDTRTDVSVTLADYRAGRLHALVLPLQVLGGDAL